jgi:hypothetical protein
MPVFIPPTEPNVPVTLGRWHPGNDLWKWFPNNDEGVTVYRLTDGTITINQPVSDPEDIARVYWGAGRHRITFEEAAELEAAGFGVDGNGEILYEQLVIEGFPFQLLSGEFLLQANRA